MADTTDIAPPIQPEDPPPDYWSVMNPETPEQKSRSRKYGLIVIGVCILTVFILFWLVDLFSTVVYWALILFAVVGCGAGGYMVYKSLGASDPQKQI